MQKIINFFPLYRVSFDDTPLPPSHDEWEHDS